MVGLQVRVGAMGAGLMVKITLVDPAAKDAFAAVVARTLHVPDVVQVKTAVVAFTEQFEVLDGSIE